MFSKRSETSGIRGQLYESKLTGLLYFRAIHDDSIEEFQLASNIDNIGAFDDICLKVKVKGLDKPVAAFIQAKHRENEKQTLKNDLVTYFDSYLKIRHLFESSKIDLIFNKTFDETHCLFVIYTTAKDEFGSDVVESSFSSKLNDLIDTGGTVKQTCQQEQHVEFLCKVTMKEQIMALAKRIAAFVNNEGNFQMMLTDELVLRYHVLLAQHVLDISEIQQAEDVVRRHRMASFRQDFFDSTDEYLILIKVTLYTEILKRRNLRPADIRFLLTEFLGDRTNPVKLSKLIGTVMTYRNGQLEFDKQSTKVFRSEMNPMDISRSTVNKAVELAAREILSSRKFKVPTSFGNKDLTISGNEVNVEKRLKYLSSKVIDLLEKCKSEKIVTLDESSKEGFLQLNGGIAGAVGNIFMLDSDTKLLKITDDWESLENLAKRLYQKLKLCHEIFDLHEYKFVLKDNKFPKLSFDNSEYEKNLARDFLGKLLFYSNQADENGVEDILKSEIDDYQRDDPNYFQVKTDAIFLKYHNEIQKWWMLPKQAPYLTRESNLFQNALNNIVKDPLITSINVTYMSKMKQYNYTFSDDAVESLKLQDQLSGRVIISENSVLTVLKVLQYLKKKEHVVLDLNYLVNLPTNDHAVLRTELTNTNEEKLLIFICDRMQNSRKEKKTLENIAGAVHDKKTIVITNFVFVEMLKKYFPRAVDKIVYDEKSTLSDMSPECQKTILDSATIMFQGYEVRLNSIVDDEFLVSVRGDILNKIISNETIAVSKLLVSRNYEDIKYLYVDRRVKKSGHDVDITVKTLYDISDDIVLITAEPGMGKSTLLTHLSLRTKEVDHAVWIVRINLLEYSSELSKWKEYRTVVDILETLKFMCQVLLREKIGKQNHVKIELEEKDGVVYLKHCISDQWTVFELKLFLHFYNKGKIIFLFDGFDEICPHYSKQVLQCLNSVSNKKHKMWVTSRSYNEVKTILQREFGSSYEIDYFSSMEMEKYLEIFWEFNLKLEELDSGQLENVKNFIEYMASAKDVQLHGFAMPLHKVYVNAAHYLINEIKYTYITLWPYNTKYDDSYLVQILSEDFVFTFHDDNSDGNPLHLFLAAVFFESNIKIVSQNTNKWNLEVNTFDFYKRFLETKMKTIRFQEKNEMNIYNPDIMITYDNELADFILKHKKLAAYAIFNQHCLKLFSMKDLEEIKEIIKFIEKGGEKTGLIYSVENGIPIFLHMNFTEYFAVEYICDCVKYENSNEKQNSWMDFVFNVMFSMERLMYVRNIFDYKINSDERLLGILENNKEIIFNLIMEQGRLYSEFTVNRYSSAPGDMNAVGINYWALSDAVIQQLHNFLLLFVKILECYLNNSNLNEFLDIVKDSQLLLSAHTYKNEALLTFVLEKVKNLDGPNLTSVLHYNFPFLSHSTVSGYVELTSQDIAKHILALEEVAEPGDFLPATPPESVSMSQWPSTSSLLERLSVTSALSHASSRSRGSRISTSSLPGTPVPSTLQSWLSSSCLAACLPPCSPAERARTPSSPAQLSTGSVPVAARHCQLYSPGVSRRQLATRSEPPRRSACGLPSPPSTRRQSL